MEIKDNRELMRNRTTVEVCRGCGSRKVHKRSYTPDDCVTYLRRKLADTELELRKLRATINGEIK